MMIARAMSCSDKKWTAVDITVPDELSDAVSVFCHEHGSGGVVLAEEGAGCTRLTAYFLSDRWQQIHPLLEDYLLRLGTLFPDRPAPVIRTAPLKDENWAVMWKDRFTPRHIGEGLLVTPPWIKPESHGRHVIVIDPGEAFGTGTHETTQGCLILLEHAAACLRQDSERFSLLDAGCGSGILAIAGRKLGAEPVLAADNDPTAIESARKNLRLNDLAGEVRPECLAVGEVCGAYDVVAANLDPMALRQNGARLIALAKRFLIIAGVPKDQWESVKGPFLDKGLSLEEEIVGQEWGCGLFSKSR